MKPAVNQSNSFVKNIKANNNSKRKIEVYTDKQGNPISKEQKERSEELKKIYKGVTKDEKLMEAMELMKENSMSEFSRKALLGNNLSGKPMMVSFEDLSRFGQTYANFDALGWKKKDRLYIYINKKHEDVRACACGSAFSRGSASGRF